MIKKGSKNKGGTNRGSIRGMDVQREDEQKNMLDKEREGQRK